MKPEKLLYNMALGSLMKTAVLDPAMAASLLGHIAPSLVGAAGGAFAAGKGRRMAGAALGGGLGYLGADLGTHLGPHIHDIVAHSRAMGEGIPQALLEHLGLAQHGPGSGLLAPLAPLANTVDDLKTRVLGKSMSHGAGIPSYLHHLLSQYGGGIGQGLSHLTENAPTVLPEHVKSLLAHGGDIGRSLGQMGSQNVASLGGQLGGGLIGGVLGSRLSRSVR